MEDEVELTAEIMVVIMAREGWEGWEETLVELMGRNSLRSAKNTRQ